MPKGLRCFRINVLVRTSFVKCEVLHFNLLGILEMCDPALKVLQDKPENHHAVMCYQCQEQAQALFHRQEYLREGLNCLVLNSA